MAFGEFGKAIGGAFKGAGKNIKGAMTGKGGGVNAGPSSGFMSRFKTAAPMALNNAAQAFGSPETKQTARMTAGMMRPQPQQQQPIPPAMGGIDTGPSGMMPGMPPPQMGPSPMGMEHGGFTGMGGSFLPQMGGNTGISGGLFNRPRLDPNTNQFGPPQSPFGNMGSIFSRIYGNMGGGQETPGRPQIYY